VTSPILSQKKSKKTQGATMNDDLRGKLMLEGKSPVPGNVWFSELMKHVWREECKKAEKSPTDLLLESWVTLDVK